MIKKTIFVTAIFLFLNCTVFAAINAAITAKAVEADVSGLMGFYEALSVDEKPQQVGDWALFAAARWFDIGAAKASQMFYGKPPMRYRFLKDTGLLEIEDGRSGVLGGEWFVLLPAETKGMPAGTAALARVIDKRRSSENEIPSKIHVFYYRFDPERKKISLEYGETIPGKKYFSPDYGYYENEVKDAAGFAAWIANSDDIVSAKWTAKGMTLAGRKYPGGYGGGLSAEDVAGLYHAYFKDRSSGKEQQRLREYNLMVNKKYEEILRMNKGLKQKVLKGIVPRRQIIQEIHKRMPYDEGGETNVGFSLDPEKDYDGLADDLLKVSRKDPSLGLPGDEPYVSILNSFAAEIEAASRRVRSARTLEPLLELRRKLRKSEDKNLRWLDETLRNLEIKNSYQAARYDGGIRGTGPAMILFYTDLIAKLWALNFDNSAPEGKIAGFRAMPDIKVSKIYWDEFLKLSNTRLWFGLRQENFGVFGSKLLMSPVVTRVYAASSDPLYPGKESQPNSQSADFLGWWDAHYAAVADYENYYHKLNQVQKWACLFMILNEEKNGSLDFLLGVPVARGADFKSWYASDASLKVRKHLPFVDGSKYGRDTECLLLMNSADYPLMDQYFFLSGGVSLASRKDIISKLRKGRAPATAAKGTARGTAKAGGPGGMPGERGLQARRTKTAGDKIVWELPVGRSARFRGDDDEFIASKTKAILSDTSGVMKLAMNMSGERLGTLSATKDQSGITLLWDGGEIAAADSLSGALASRLKFTPDGDNFLASLPGFEAVKRAGDGSYLLRPAGSKKWLHLTINGEQKRKENVFYVRAAGMSTAADVYQTEIMEAAPAEEMGGTKIK
jgi:hypothetical protein